MSRRAIKSLNREESMNPTLKQLTIHSKKQAEIIDDQSQKIIILEAQQTVMITEFQKLKERVHQLEHRDANVTNVYIGNTSKQPPTFPFPPLDLR